jgi:hypothetical protein
MSRYSSFINSFLQYRPFSWLSNDNKTQFRSLFVPTLEPTLEPSSYGVVRRQGSNTGVQSNMYIGTRGDYAYDIDTCQTIYLVEKRSDATYDVTILYTKEFRPFWLGEILKMIMIRILIAEQQISVLSEIFARERGWKIIGSVDCQKDRNYSVNQFHQDSLSSAFINPMLEQTFGDFLRDIFSPREEYFSPTVFPGVSLGGPQPAPVNRWFKVNSCSTAHFGILDYDSIAKIIAAAIKFYRNYLCIKRIGAAV